MKSKHYCICVLVSWLCRNLLELVTITEPINQLGYPKWSPFSSKNWDMYKIKVSPNNALTFEIKSLLRSCACFMTVLKPVAGSEKSWADTSGKLPQLQFLNHATCVHKIKIPEDVYVCFYITFTAVNTLSEWHQTCTGYIDPIKHSILIVVYLTATSAALSD